MNLLLRNIIFKWLRFSLIRNLYWLLIHLIILSLNDMIQIHFALIGVIIRIHTRVVTLSRTPLKIKSLAKGLALVFRLG